MRTFLPLIVGLILGVLATCAFSHRGHPTWEYKAVWINPQRDMAQLNLNGTTGWEISAVIPSPDGNSCFILKRRK